MNNRIIQDVLLVAIVILVLIIGCNWQRSKPTIIKGAETTIVKWKTKTDTIHKEKIVPKLVYATTHDTIHDTITLIELDSIRLYDLFNSDSSVLVQSKVRGLLIEAIINAKLKETYTTRVDTFCIKEFKPSLRPLVFAVADTSRVTGGLGAIYTGKKSSFMAGYNFVNKSVLVGFGVNISKNK